MNVKKQEIHEPLPVGTHVRVEKRHSNFLAIRLRPDMEILEFWMSTFKNEVLFCSPQPLAHLDSCFVLLNLLGMSWNFGIDSCFGFEINNDGCSLFNGYPGSGAEASPLAEAGIRQQLCRGGHWRRVAPHQGEGSCRRGNKPWWTYHVHHIQYKTLVINAGYWKQLRGGRILPLSGVPARRKVHKHISLVRSVAVQMQQRGYATLVRKCSTQLHKLQIDLKGDIPDWPLATKKGQPSGASPSFF